MSKRVRKTWNWKNNQNRSEFTFLWSKSFDYWYFLHHESLVVSQFWKWPFYFKFQWVRSGPDRLACLPFLLAKFTSKFLSFRLFFVWKINLNGFSVLFIQTFCSLCSFDSFLWHSRAAQCIDNFLGLVQRSSMCDAMEIAHFGRLADIQYTLQGAPASFGLSIQKIFLKLG